jgi:hypothetical protein
VKATVWLRLDGGQCFADLVDNFEDVRRLTPDGWDPDLTLDDYLEGDDCPWRLVSEHRVTPTGKVDLVVTVEFDEDPPLHQSHELGWCWPTWCQWINCHIEGETEPRQVAA